MAVNNSSETFQLGTFLLDGQLFGVNILNMREIIRPVDIVKVPRAPTGVEGVINLRGEVIPIINLRARLGMPGRTFDKDTRIINMYLNGIVAGFLVDAIGPVKQIRSDAVSEPPAVSTGGEDTFISGVIQDGDNLVMMLDLGRFVDPEVLKNIPGVGESS